MEYGKSNQYSGMVFQVLNWNEPAINFYKKYSPKFDDEWLMFLLNLNKLKIDEMINLNPRNSYTKFQT
jgi:hypothetical protein